MASRQMTSGSITKSRKRRVWKTFHLDAGIIHCCKVAKLFQTHRILVYEDDSADNTADAIRKEFASLGGIAMLVR